MARKAQKSKSRHRQKRADEKRVKVVDRCVGTSRSYIIPEQEKDQTAKQTTQEDPRDSLSIYTRADFRAQSTNADSPVVRTRPETNVPCRTEVIRNESEDKKEHFLPEIAPRYKPLSWDDRIDEFCGQNSLDDVVYIRHTKQGCAFTQYIGTGRPTDRIPRTFSDGTRYYVTQRRPHHLPRLHSDGAMERRANKPPVRQTKPLLTRDQSVQHRNGGEFIENVRHASVQKRLDRERKNMQQKIRQFEKDMHASGVGRQDRPLRTDVVSTPVRLPDRPQTSASVRNKVQDVVGEQDKLRVQSYLKAMSDFMKKSPHK
ncbi:hypothetical protein ACF0H5_010626 [Mactra antiquata]